MGHGGKTRTKAEMRVHTECTEEDSTTVEQGLREILPRRYSTTDHVKP